MKIFHSRAPSPLPPSGGFFLIPRVLVSGSKVATPKSDRRIGERPECSDTIEAVSDEDFGDRGSSSGSCGPDVTGSTSGHIGCGEVMGYVGGDIMSRAYGLGR